MVLGDYTILNPDWFYSYVDIPNWDQIKQELNACANEITGQKLISRYGFQFNKSPALMAYLKEVGLHHKVRTYLFFRRNSTSIFDLHVDSADPSHTSIALNIPLFDYEDSFMCFYKAKDNKLILGSDSGGTLGKSYATYDRAKVTEIKRARLNKPILINTTILHAGEVNNPERFIMSLRFEGNLTQEEIQKMGVLPYKQVDV